MPVVQLPQGTAVLLLRRHEFPTRFCNKVLAAVKFSLQRSGLVKGLTRETSEVLIRNEVDGCGKMANNWNNLVKGSSMRQKLQNSKGYAESPEFQPALGQ